MSTNAEVYQEDLYVPSEQESLENGPMGPLVRAVYEKQPILVGLRSNKKIYGFVKAVDRHWNMILENCKEVYQPPPINGQKSPIKCRTIKRVFLRGDNVVCVYPNPVAVQES